MVYGLRTLMSDVTRKLKSILNSINKGNLSETYKSDMQASGGLAPSATISQVLIYNAQRSELETEVKIVAAD